ncbi:MAG TPA: divergent polysaccharide deacetylase family protein, partial [Acidobacteriota bacterium]|nr:divergent polysaccharide deacetylase family protein [Acidobacteriota bacterium]
ALIVDDMGNSQEALEELLGLGEPVTVAILPYSPYALETARKAHEKGLEVLLHLPLESLNGNDAETGTEGLIRSGMSEEEVRSLLSEELDRIPYVRGVNNHMGSKVTADAAMMRAILEPIRERGLFFLDSRTSAKSVAYDVAVGMGIPAASRQVFLDADGDTGRIRERLFELFRIARRDGRAVGICHPFKETLQTLKENFGLLGSYGLKAVFASELAGR